MLVGAAAADGDLAQKVLGFVSGSAMVASFSVDTVLIETMLSVLAKLAHAERPENPPAWAGFD